MVSGPDRVRLAVLGAGYMAVASHLPVLAARPDVDLVSVCRLGAEPLRAIQRRFGFRVATEDAAEALAAGVDAALVATPNTLHAAHAGAALDAGLHVLVEKPISTDPADGWRLAALARRRGLHLLVPYGWQYASFVRRAKHLLDADGVGRIEHVSCVMASPTAAVFAGTGGYGSVRLGDVTIEADRRTWAAVEAGGGYAFGQLSHAVGLLAWLTGLRARRVMGWTRPGPSGVDVADAGVVEFVGGARATLSGYASAPAHHPYQLELRIHGADGMLLLDVERERCELVRHDRRDVSVPVAAGAGRYSCDEPPGRFVELVRGLSTDNPSPAEPAAAAVDVLAALLRSAATAGAVVDVPDREPFDSADAD